MAEEFSLENASEEDVKAFLAVKRAFGNKKAKKLIQQALKEGNPDLDIPELELEQAIEERVGGVKKEFQDFKDSMAKEKLKEKLESARSALRDDGFSEDDLKAIEEMMQKESIPNHATAARLFKLERQAAMPTPQVNWASKKAEKFVVPEDAMKDTGSLKQWALNEAHTALDDIQKAAR